MYQLHSQKPPKLRFKIGDVFMEDGEPLKIVAMYRIEREPSIWYHVLDITDFNDMAIGPGSNIHYNAFRDHAAASQVTQQIPCNGYYRTTKSTQELLKLKRVEHANGNSPK